MVGHNLPPSPDWDRVNWPENLGKAVALPALPLITYAPSPCKKNYLWGDAVEKICCVKDRNSEMECTVGRK